MLRQDSLIQAFLVSIGWRYASAYSGGHMAGQLVMCTIANRVRTGWSQSWLTAIDGVPKYMAENEMPPLVWPSIWDANLVKLLHAVEGIHSGSAADLSKGALYWADLNHVENPWFKEKIIDAVDENGLRVHPLVANINSLSFFR